MGQRSATESVAAVLAAFLRRRVWTQADLARATGLERAESLRRVLEELKAAGIPLEPQKDHPHVYWRVPKTWFPGGVLFRAEDVPDLRRQLSRLPPSKVRDRLLSTLTEQLPARGKLAASAPVVSRPASETEQQWLHVVEDAAARKVPLLMKYSTASRGGRASERHVSVHLCDVGPPVRFIGTCHKNGDLRWFRVEGISRARVDEAQKFRECAPSELAAFRRASLDGFKGATPPVTCSFFVREPESVWVANNLLEGMHVESVHAGIRVSADTSAVLPLARFVVGLGDAARPETSVLAQMVAKLARGAMEQAETALGELERLQPSSELHGDAARLRSDV
jgi:predicted DNA-binding transcriptional regulator YafY